MNRRLLDTLFFTAGILAILGYGSLHVYRHFEGHDHAAPPLAEEAAARLDVPTTVEPAAAVTVKLFADRAEPAEVVLEPGRPLVFLVEEGVHDIAEGEGNAESRAHTHNYGAKHSGDLHPGERYETVPQGDARYFHDHLNPDIFVRVDVLE